MFETEDPLPLDGMTVLVVDAAGATRRLLRDCLSSLGSASINYAHSAAQAMQLLGESVPDIILCEFYLNEHRTGQQLLEDLRSAGLLHWKTLFIMITGEQSYKAVFGAAEFEPDAYIIKPFSIGDLATRLSQIILRKQTLLPITWLIAEKHYDRALQKATELTLEFPQYAHDIFRIRVTLLVNIDRFDEAIELLEEMLESQPAAWMRLALAQLRIRKKELPLAERELRKVLVEKPEFIHARDLLADVLVEQDRGKEAIQVLESIGTMALQNLDRLRKMADLAARINDIERTTKYLEQAVKRSKGSVLCNADDFVSLASVLISQGRLPEAEAVALNMGQFVKGEDLRAAKLLIDISKDIQSADQQKAHKRLQDLIAIFNPEKKRLPAPELHVSLVESCFTLNQRTEGFSQARTLLSRRAKKAILDRLRAAISKSNKQVEAEAEANKEAAAVNLPPP